MGIGMKKKEHTFMPVVKMGEKTLVSFLLVDKNQEILAELFHCSSSKSFTHNTMKGKWALFFIYFIKMQKNNTGIHF